MKCFEEVAMKKLFSFVIIAFFISGCTDKSVDPPKPAGSISAQEYFYRVSAKAGEYGSDMVLTTVRGTDVDSNGTANYWVYTYQKGAQATGKTYWFTGTAFDATCDSITKNPLGFGTVQEGWVDSRRALDSAEQRDGKAFRAAHPNASIGILLMRGNVLGAVTEWWIVYNSNDGSPSRTVKLEALTGKFIESFDVAAGTVKKDS